VHLAVACPSVAARAIDLLHDHRRLAHAQAGAAELLRDQRSQPSRPGKRRHEFLRIGMTRIHVAEVARREFGAKRPHAVANLAVAMVADHGWSPRGSSNALSVSDSKVPGGACAT